MKNSEKLMLMYEKFLEDGKMSREGICMLPMSDLYSKLLHLMEPSNQDYSKLRSCNLSSYWWGSGLRKGDPLRRYTFTPLRQTILLFIIEMAKDYEKK